MRNKTNRIVLVHLILLMFVSSIKINAQVHPNFTPIKTIPTTSVKNQNRTGTCWSYAATSFLETEALRMGKPALDLSEMYFVKHAYEDKAKKYVRYHGNNNFDQGGQAHDVLNVIRKHGLVLNEVYTGLQHGKTYHNHSEMVNLLKGMLDGLLNTKKNKPSEIWLPAVNSAVEAYLGKAPKEVKFKGKNYSPVDFSKKIVGINPDDYIELTSFKDYPFYKQIDLELPDNWSHDLYYNIPINDLMSIMDNAIKNGYSVCWDGDVSEDDFNHKNGTAVLSLEESDGIIITGINEMRQKTFDNFTTTDDHLMHITGTAKDKNGAMFFLTKNSWGLERNKFGGYLYMSNWYIQLKTVAIMVHKNAIPKDLKKKLGL